MNSATGASWLDPELTAALGLGQQQAEDALSVSGHTISQAVVIRRAKLDLLELSTVTLAADLTIEDCKIDVLRLQQVSGDGVLRIRNCMVGRLDVAAGELSRPIEIEHLHAGQIVVEQCGPLRIAESTVDTTTSLRGVGGACTLDGVKTERMEISQTQADAELTISRCIVHSMLLLRESELRSVELEQTQATDLRISEVLLDAPPLQLTRVHTIRECRINAAAHAGAPVVALHELLAEFEVRLELALAGGGTPALEIESSRFNDGLTVRSPDGQFAGQLKDVEIRGQLDFDVEAVSTGATRFTLHDSEIEDMSLPSAPLRSPRMVTDFARRTFGASNPSSLAAIRSALLNQNRLQEEDQAYAALQSEVSRGAFGGLRRALFGGVLGWGTRVWPPARALIVLIALTALTLLLAWPGSLVDPHALGAVLASFGIWADIETGFLEEPATSSYFTLKAFCGAAGLAFVTLIVGIVIRKLVR